MELQTIVFRSIEKFAVGLMNLLIVFRVFNVEIGDPAKFTKDISLERNSGVVWYSRTFDFVLFIRV